MAGPEILTDIDGIDDLEFERRTLAAIRKELGLAGLARFLAKHRSGPGDYTAERQQWVDHLTPDEIMQGLAELPHQPH
jgi:hypothetical protein